MVNLPLSNSTSAYLTPFYTSKHYSMISVCERNGKPIVWYFTNMHGQIMKRKQHQLTAEGVVDYFMKIKEQESPVIVGMKYINGKDSNTISDLSA